MCKPLWETGRQSERDKTGGRGIWELLCINPPYYQISLLAPTTSRILSIYRKAYGQLPVDDAWKTRMGQLVWNVWPCFMWSRFIKDTGNLRAPMNPVGITLSSPVEQPSQQDLEATSKVFHEPWNLPSHWFTSPMGISKMFIGGGFILCKPFVGDME